MTAAMRIVDAVRGVECRPAMAFQNLALAPLVADGDREAGYVVLDDALARGWVTVTEVGEGGHVPELKVVNRGDVAVLLLDGEELVGAKQNRVLNLTISCRPSTRLRSRCRASSRAGGDMSRTSSARLPARSLPRGERRRCTRSRAPWRRMVPGGLTSRPYGAPCGKVGTPRCGVRHGGYGRDVQEAGSPLEDFVAAFRPVDRQVGAVFLVNGRLAGLELFDAPSTWRKLSPKLVRSYALDAIDRKQAQPPVASQDGRFLIDAVAASQSAVFPAVGEGDDVRLSGRDVIGAALVRGSGRFT